MVAKAVSKCGENCPHWENVILAENWPTNQHIDMTRRRSVCLCMCECPSGGGSGGSTVSCCAVCVNNVELES